MDRDGLKAPMPDIHSTVIPTGRFVTGTDTQVGKTSISEALLQWCAAQGWRSAGFKPVAAGTQVVDGESGNDEVRRLRQASSLPLTDAEVGPLQFAAACAPNIAADLEGRRIDYAWAAKSAQRLLARADVVVVDGVGGFCVPLGPTSDTSHIVCALGLPLILVVGLRRGCLNHALLTVEAIRSRRLPVLGWIGNAMTPQMAHLSANLDTLRHKLDGRRQIPCLGVVPWLTQPTPQAVAVHLDDEALQRIFRVISTGRRA